MRPRPRNASSSGFSIVELLVVLAIMGILAAMGVPWLKNIIHKAKMDGLLSNGATAVRQARSESIKQNVNTVVRFDLAQRRIETFADRDGATVLDPPDGVFNPVAGEAPRTTDYWISTFALPGGIDFTAPGALNEIDGFTTADNNGTAEQVAILLSDGSITDVGAVRLGDQRGNFFEIRIAPQGTARIQIQKWDYGASEWFEQDEDGNDWEWF